MRLMVILCAIAAGFGLLAGWLIFRDDPNKDRMTAARQGQQMATETGKVIERTYERTNTIYKQAEVSADAVENATGGDVPVPDDVLAGFRAGVGGLREQAGAGADRGSARPAG